MAHRRPTASRLANHTAEIVLGAFTAYRAAFLAVTRRARQRFERRDWASGPEDASRRLALYREAVDRAEHRVRQLLGERLRDRVVWVSAKAVYSGRIASRQDWELAETFFNGITRRVFTTVGVDPLVEFVATDFDAPPTEEVERTRGTFEGPDLGTRIAVWMSGLPLSAPWLDLRGDAARVAARVASHLAAQDVPVPPGALEVLRPLFFRGKGAYAVARLWAGARATPVVLALRHGPRGLFVDAVLLDADDVSVLFGFTRSYFHVEVDRTWEVVRFLSSLIPRKRVGEIYIAIGEPKHGKTELFRSLVDHLEDTDEQFVRAPGVAGLVMEVVTMPGLDMVLKIVRDRFPPEKTVTRELVGERYQWVYTHDRAGRLVDTQVFEHLALPADRFDEGLLADLLAECGETARVEDGELTIARAFVQRRIVPLDRYVREAPAEAATAAVREYANAIADLAACNIFPGDLLAKNFGVTRHGRVAFYDYDEVTPLVDLVFRDIPPPRFPEDEMSADPWFTVGPADVFPEQFPRFLGLPADLRRLLVRDHPEIFRASWWRDVQERIRAGKITEVPPYPADRRLADPAARETAG